MRVAYRRLFVLAFVSIGFIVETTAAATLPVVQWVNGASQDAMTVLGNKQPFVTSFKGTNDLTVTLTGSVQSLMTDDFHAVGNNPSYLTNFVGSAANGTGDGTPGGLTFLDTLNGDSLQFDFAVPLLPTDRMIVDDVDNNEVYTIQAFTKVGQIYVPVSLTSWLEQPFTGLTGTLPNNDWPTWNAASGTFTGSGARITEPLNILTPSQSIDRIIFSQVADGSGNAGIQFMGVPEPSAIYLGTIAAFAAGVLLRATRRQSSS